MAVSRVYTDHFPEQLNQTCGFCNTVVYFSKLSDSYKFADNGLLFAEREEYYSALFQCPKCNKQSLFILGSRNVSGKTYYYKTQFPKSSPEHMSEVPKNIEDDRFEAWKCYLSGCYKASAIMARASLQNAVRSLNAKGNDLYHEILDLKERGIITNQIADFAHEVRITGNDVAHPNELTIVSQEEIEESLEFLNSFLHIVFVLPSLVDKRKEGREERKNKA